MVYVPSKPAAGLDKSVEEIPAELVSRYILQELVTQNERLQTIQGYLKFFVVLNVIGIIAILAL